jgi:hypothetical protein
MLGFPLGILSAAGAGGVAGTYELIETQILGSNQASIIFSNLGTYSSTYKHLQIRYAAQTSATVSDNTPLVLRMNGDTGANYRYHDLFGNGSSVQSSSGAEAWPGQLTTQKSGMTNRFAPGVLDILDAFSATKNTTVRGFCGTSGVDTSYVLLKSSLWNNTASITSLTVSGVSGNLITGSRFSLYGIRG